MCYAFSSSIPTVFLAECVLIYVDPKQTESMLEWIANRFETAMFINYQPVCCQQIHPSFDLLKIIQFGIRSLSFCIFLNLKISSVSCIGMTKKDQLILSESKVTCILYGKICDRLNSLFR